MSGARLSWIIGASAAAASLSPADGLPPGYVQGDVVSYSYVPIRSWTLQEGIGILPYLFEYGLTLWDDSLEAYHSENIRRIDIVSQWSTAIGLSNRESSWRNEIVNLMIRCFRNRQLIILAARPGKHDYHQNMIDLLDYLWTNRDTVLTSPEGDQATGRQLINNILAADVGDEEECGLRTTGLQQRFAQYDQDIRLRQKDGQYPFSHIRCWFNMLHYGVGCYAAGQSDVDHYGRVFLPTNTKFIGVDTYEYWSGSGVDPRTMTSAARRAVADSWQDVITRYYPRGLSVSPCGTWTAACKNDTHALLNGLPAAGANEAMMIFIANSHDVSGCHTTPIETMDAYYDSLKAGPWVGLTWYVFEDYGSGSLNGTKRYIDKTLIHFTGAPYTQQQLNDFHDRFVASRMRMFNDVVYNQFGYLNPRPPGIAEVAPDPDIAAKRVEYVRTLRLEYGATPVTWSVVRGPAGTQVDANGRVSGWTPGGGDVGRTFTFEIRAANSLGADTESWQVYVAPLPNEVIAWFSFEADAEGWALSTWRSGPYDYGMMAWNAAGGHWDGHLTSAGAGSTNSGDTCTREGSEIVRVGPTVGFSMISVQYDVAAALSTPPPAGCAGICPPASLLEGTCEDKLVVYYSVTWTDGPWMKAEELNEGDDLPATWTRRTIDLSGDPRAADNADFALKFAWQFNSAYDVGRIDNVSVLGRPPRGDFDRDCDVDLQDFVFFQVCFQGPNQPVSTGCADADMDDDGDVDPDDFTRFQVCFNGANRWPACPP